MRQLRSDEITLGPGGTTDLTRRLVPVQHGVREAREERPRTQVHLDEQTAPTDVVDRDVALADAEVGDVALGRVPVPRRREPQRAERRPRRKKRQQLGMIRKTRLKDQPPEVRETVEPGGVLHPTHPEAAIERGFLDDERPRHRASLFQQETGHDRQPVGPGPPRKDTLVLDGIGLGSGGGVMPRVEHGDEHVGAALAHDGLAEGHPGERSVEVRPG